MKKILVVNNDMDTMALLKSWLEKKTYKVKYTSKQDEVPEIVKEFDPDLLLVDILQKGVIEQSIPVPVLLMTGYTSRPKTSELPVDDTIEKPFNLPLLEKKIEKLVLQKKRTG